jgi:hypothetical protein
MEERRLVTHLLETAYRELRSEIYKTESAPMKAELKHDEKVLAGVLKKLGLEKELRVS